MPAIGTFKHFLDTLEVLKRPSALFSRQKQLIQLFGNAEQLTFKHPSHQPQLRY